MSAALDLFAETATAHDPGGKTRIKIPDGWKVSAEFSDPDAGDKAASVVSSERGPDQSFGQMVLGPAAGESPAYKLPIQRGSSPTLYRLFLAQPQEWPASLYLLEGERRRNPGFSAILSRLVYSTISR